MVLAHTPPPATPRERVRYLCQPVPLHFPEEAEVPESQLHLDLRTLLYHLLLDHLGAAATVGSDQFVYWAADDPRQVLAPDVYVRLSPAGEPIRSWKTWERGAPEVAVEIVSDMDRPELAWEQKLRRYRALGVSELLRFDPREGAERRLRLWDRVEGDLAEREVERDRAASLVLGVTWVVAPAEGHAVALRIATDGEGRELVPTRAEAREAEARAREAEARAREAAERRVAELEAELSRRGG